MTGKKTEHIILENSLLLSDGMIIYFLKKEFKTKDNSKWILKVANFKNIRKLVTFYSRERTYKSCDQIFKYTNQ